VAASMKITMDCATEVSVECDEESLVVSDVDESPICVPLDRVEEFIGHIQKVVEFHRSQTKPAE